MTETVKQWDVICLDCGAEYSPKGYKPQWCQQFESDNLDVERVYETPDVEAVADGMDEDDYQLTPYEELDL